MFRGQIAISGGSFILSPTLGARDESFRLCERAKRREGRVMPSTVLDRSHGVSYSYPDQATRVRVVGSGTPWQGVPRGITSVVSRAAAQVKSPSSKV